MSNGNETGTPAPRMPREVFDVYLEYFIDNKLGESSSESADPNLNLMGLLVAIMDATNAYIDESRHLE